MFPLLPQEIPPLLCIPIANSKPHTTRVPNRGAGTETQRKREKKTQTNLKGKFFLSLSNSPMKMPTVTTGGDVSPIHNDDMNERLFAEKGCCSWLPCFGLDPSPSYGSIGWERMRTPDNNEKCCWKRGWMKIREWSKKVAGPKCKTLIRRFHRNRNHGYTKQRKFQYDPLSYALNFDEGKGQKGKLDDDYNFRDFSTRYAAIPASAKSSMDLGKDGPALT